MNDLGIDKVRMEFVMLGLALLGIVMVLVFLIRADGHARKANDFSAENNKILKERNVLFDEEKKREMEIKSLILERCR